MADQHRRMRGKAAPAGGWLSVVTEHRTDYYQRQERHQSNMAVKHTFSEAGTCARLRGDETEMKSAALRVPAIAISALGVCGLILYFRVSFGRKLVRGVGPVIVGVVSLPWQRQP